MTITVELPNDVASRPNAGREALEALAIEGFRSEVFTHHEAATLLGFNRFEFEAFLKSRSVTEHAYSVEDLRQDIATGDRLRAAGFLPR